jgi:hypothetical protein
MSDNQMNSAIIILASVAFISTVIWYSDRYVHRSSAPFLFLAALAAVVIGTMVFVLVRDGGV